MAASSTDSAAGDSPARVVFAELNVYLIALIFFAICAGLTIYFNRSMSAGMPMPGNWTMSMMWMIMPGDTWFTGSLGFIAMWTAMMIAMMLPSTLPMLLLYRRAAAFHGEAHSGGATFLVASGYFLVWTLFGVVAFTAGLGISQGAMHSDPFSRLVPLAGGLGLCIAGIYQLTPWKSTCLKHCRDPLTVVAHHLQRGRLGAFRLGIHHGAFCVACCWGLMLMQLVLGVMNLWVMMVLAVIIALEKLLVRGEFVARLTGAGAIVAGATVAARSLI
jgi:predicted metal-binding membrane protein